MRKNRVRNVIIHTVSADTHSLCEQLNEFHAGVIRRKLYNMAITPQQKIQILDKIINMLNALK